MNKIRENYWTEERENELRKHWKAKLSAAEIVEAMGGGVLTRNAVIGKANRLKLDARPNPISFNGSRMFGKIAKVSPLLFKTKKIKPRKEAKGQAFGDEKPMADLGQNECRYPTKKIDGLWHFCAGTIEDAGRPYCPHHEKLCGGQRKSGFDTSQNA